MNATKEHIIKTSLILFLQKSYRDVTMSEIVEKTGLSKGAFYHYFTSKEQLFREITMLIFSMGEIRYSSFNDISLEAFYKQYIDFLDSSFKKMYEMASESSSSDNNLNFFLIMFEAVSRFPDFLDKELANHKRDMEAWIRIIATARQNGEIITNSSDEEIANLFLYCTDGVFMRFVNNDKVSDYKSYLLEAYNSIYVNIKA